MSESKELVSLTLNDEKFESFPDQQAREGLGKKLPLPDGAATVGQYLRVAAVDENGKITALESADIPNSSGNADQSGLSAAAVNLLMDVLNAVQYHTNVSGKIEQLREALLSGAGSGGTGGGDTPDEPDEPVVVDDITVSNGIMTIVTVGSAITVSDGVMTIA